MKKNRRDFLKKAGLLGSVSFLSPAASLGAFVPDAQKQNIDSEHIEEKSFTISILQTTDVHCQVHAHDELFWENNKAVFRKTGGYARLATFLKKYRRENPDTFLIDTGDMFQGSELSVKTTGKAIVPILNKLDYNLYLPGNWEVVYYKKSMQTLLGALHAPKVCANMFHDAGDGNRGELIFPPYYTWVVKGVKIGFLGYTDHLVPIRQSPAFSRGIVYTKPEESLAYYIDLLRNQEQCAYVIMLAHLGLSQQIHLANLPECNGVDYIFGGDTHERVRTPIVCKYSKVVEPGAFGSFVGKLTLNITDGKVTGDMYELIEVTADAYKPDAEIEKLITANEQPFAAEINEIVGYSRVPLYRYFVVENTIDTMVLDALEWKLKDRGIDFIVSNGFRFCPPRVTRDATGNIPITRGFVYDMMPVDSPIRTAKVSGMQVQSWIEKELNNVFAKEPSERLGGWVIKLRGMEISFNAFGEKGKRVQNITIGKKPLDPEKIYTFCACEREGDPEDMLCRIKGVTEGRNIGFTMHEAMLEYLKANSPVAPLPKGSAKILDASPDLLTQVSGVKYEFR